MTKVAFCFPGQGSLEIGMGREIAEAVPEAMEVYRLGSEVTGMDLAHLCFEAPLDVTVRRLVDPVRPIESGTPPGGGDDGVGDGDVARKHGEGFTLTVVEPPSGRRTMAISGGNAP